MKYTWPLLCLISCLMACAPKKEDEKGRIHVAFKPTGLPIDQSLADQTADYIRNIAVASGPPDGLTLYVKSMALKTSDGITRTIFQDSKGRALRMGRKTIDFSDLFAGYACINDEGLAVDGVENCSCGLDENNQAIERSAQGICPDTGRGAVGEEEMETGTYESMTLEFFAVAKVKGCVTGNFVDMGSRTYCTKAAAHTFQDSPGVDDPEELEGTADKAEVMVYQIHAASSESFTMAFPITGGFTIEADAESPQRVTLMIDLNRMLRFYNKNQATEESDRAFFFSSVFEESIFAIPGIAGEVRGFHWWTDGTSATSVAGWLTVIKDQNQKPLAVGLMPDDDYAANIIRGSNKTTKGIEAGAFLPNAAHYDIGFAWGQNVGVIQNVDLEAALSSTQVTGFLGLQNESGKIYLKRAF